MKILFVCQQYIHSARWINQLKDTDHEIYVFDCLDAVQHPDLKWTNFIGGWSKRKLPYIKGEHFLKKYFPKFYETITPVLKITPEEKLLQIIQEVKPDLVHSLEMYSQTYHVLKAKKKLNFKWAYFSWGSDIHLHQSNKGQLSKIKEVLPNIDYFFTDNHRDVKLARQFGYQKEETYVFPGGGGYKLEDYKEVIKPVEERNMILIKGYHHWAGRALPVLEALELIKDELKDHDVYVYAAHPIVVTKIKELNRRHSMNISFSTRKEQLSHNELLSKFGKAKIAIGNSLSDGIPNTLLEAIICGAFPIQSNPGGASEDYIIDGINGYLIHDPENVKDIAQCIVNAMTDNVLLEKAFVYNQERSKEIAYTTIQEQVVDVYKKIAAQ